MNTDEDGAACDRSGGGRPLSELFLGAHIVSPRTGYLHHGIYVGDGCVVHYPGFERGLRSGPVETVSLEHFMRGRSLRVLDEGAPYFEAAEIVERALSRIGEDRYHVLTNNCEHFCEWCVNAEPRSFQVDGVFHWLTAPLRLVRGVRNRARQMSASLVNALSCLSSSGRFHP